MPDTLKPTLKRLAAGQTVSAEESEHAFSLIMDGQATQAQSASLLTALHLRGETTAELTGAVQAMRARMLTIQAPPDTIDVCGTGGDGHNTRNVSTATAFVVAACGIPVAKHGNRALSSNSGAADVLEALGLPTDTPLAHLPDQLARTGLAFLFAPNHHPALRHANAVRKELGFRTIFNLLGPLCSPAGVTRQLTGVYAPAWTAPLAETLGALGSQCAWVVHGAGLDELTLAGETRIAEWRHGRLRQFTVTPEDAGLTHAPISAIAGGGPVGNAAALLALLSGEPGAYRDTVLLNAAACLVIADRADSLADGVQQSARAIDNGAALAILEALRQPAPITAD